MSFLDQLVSYFLMTVFQCLPTSEMVNFTTAIFRRRREREKKEKQCYFKYINTYLTHRHTQIEPVSVTTHIVGNISYS